MRRRRFIAAVGASLALAGCSTEGSTPETDGDVTPAPPPSIDGTTTEAPETDPGPGSDDRETPGREDFRADAFAVGEPAGEINPMGLTIDNDGSDERTVHLEITDTQARSVLLNETFDVDGEIRGEIRVPSDYEIRVGVPAEGIQTVETIDEGLFDTCNNYGTTISIGHGGNFETQTRSTLAECRSAPIRSFAVGERVGEIGPLGVAIRNAGDTARAVNLRITDTASEEMLLDESYTVAPDSSVEGEIRLPSDYEIRATVPEEGTETVETIDEGLFDTCNSYGTTITVGHGGGLDAQTASTLVLCDTDVTVTGSPERTTTDGGNA